MFSKLKLKSETGFTLIETAAVIFATVSLLAVVFRVVGVQSSVASAKATQIYQTSVTLANNWKRLSQAAGVPYGTGAAYWAPNNPLLACATSTCAPTADLLLDGQRTIKVLMEGPSAMNPAYSSAWTSSHLTPSAGIQKIGTYYYLLGIGAGGAASPPALWGSGSKGVEYYAMGPIMVYYGTGVSEEVATEIARKYGKIDITSSSQTQTSGPVHFTTADSGGPGYRAIGFEFP